MKSAIIMKVASVLYSAYLREKLIELIDNPDSDIDEKAIKALDLFFGYKGKES